MTIREKHQTSADQIKAINNAMSRWVGDLKDLSAAVQRVQGDGRWRVIIRIENGNYDYTIRPGLVEDEP